MRDQGLIRCWNSALEDFAKFDAFAPLAITEAQCQLEMPVHNGQRIVLRTLSSFQLRILQCVARPAWTSGVREQVLAAPSNGSAGQADHQSQSMPAGCLRSL